MYNTDIPTRAELPTSKQLIRSTIIALLAAIAILVTIVLPAEYNIDPTGIGKKLGLAEMGEIKLQLAEEAEQDRLRDLNVQPVQSDKRSGLLERLFTEFVIGSASAQTAPKTRSDEMSVKLTPGEGAEIKLTMIKNAKVNYSWQVAGGVVNYDLHGSGADGSETSYEKGRAVPRSEGILTAPADGIHGWFWRNRGKGDVTITLRTNGDYSEIKRVK